MKLTVGLTLQLHQLLLQYLGDGGGGGQFKNVDNVIAEVQTDGARHVRFTPTPAWQTPDAVRSLVERYHEALGRDDLHPIAVIAGFILDFSCIHPFRDGNGRTSRLLTMLCLYHNGYTVGRYVSLERRIHDSGMAYYDALQQSSDGWHDSTHDVVPWINYVVGVLLRAYDLFEDGVAVVTSQRGGKREAITRFVHNHPRTTFAFADVREAVPLASDAMIRKVLVELRDAGEIRSLGRGRSARWERIDE